MRVPFFSLADSEESADIVRNDNDTTMTSQSLHRLFLLPLLGAFLLSSISLCAQNELVPNPAAVKLRRIWTQEGKHLTAAEYGYAVSGVPDISGDSIRDFAVYRNSDNTWLFYHGGNPPDTIPFWSMDSVGSVPPYIGKFWGDDRRYMLFRDGYEEIVEGYSYLYDRVRLFEVTQQGISSQPAVEVDQGKNDPPVERYLRNFFALDMNDDSVDDLALSLGGLRIGQVRTADLTRQVWFYMGGENFQLDSPTVIVRDTSRYGTPDNWEVHFADFDGDGRMDMVMGGSYPTGGPMLRFYWGDDNSPYSWATRPPDRDLKLIHGQIGINSIVGMGIYDLNGDGAADIGSYEYADVAGSRIYLSGNGKNARTRSFAIDDADYYLHDGVISSVSSGYINDSTRRYEAVGFGAERNGLSAELEVSGSSYGPDHDYEAWFSWQEEGLVDPVSLRIVAADVTGDGYDDQIHSDYRYGPFVNTGIAIVLAGGPYIPFDDTTVGIVEYPVAGDAGGLYLWPNPVVDELHIAWKGNLKRMPARFVVYDLNGKEVVAGDVRPHLGAALWRCGSVAAGSYVIVAFDADGKTIASARVVKQ